MDVSGIRIHPGFDPAGLSDEEIQAKLVDLNARLIYANNFSANAQILAQLRDLQSILTFEQKQRLEREREAIKASQYKIIETEPDLRTVDPKKEIQRIAKRDDKKKIHVPIITKKWTKDKVDIPVKDEKD